MAAISTTTLKEVNPISPIRQAFGNLQVSTGGRQMIELTDDIAAWIHEIGAGNGDIVIFCRHTSASLTIQENADFRVQNDLITALDRIAPEDAAYTHSSEGPDDMPAHIKSMLTSVSHTVPVLDGRMALGTWQGIYLVEHRRAPHERSVILRYRGE